MEEDDENFVYWVEKRGRGCFLQATPIDVSDIVAEKLFDKVDTVVLTSATLAVAGGFEFTREAAGAGERAHPGRARPFRLPEAGAALRAAAPARAAQSGVHASWRPRRWSRILEHSRGRAFVLFTSYQQMRLVYDRVSLEIEYPTLLQGTGPRNALLEEFRATPNCVLFATSSFWQGVDVPGEQLSCVIIDKLPFAVPNDPVVNARIERHPQAPGAIRSTITRFRRPPSRLKQGFGRLIRSRTRSRRAGAAGQPDHQAALRAGVFRQPAGLRIHHQTGRTWRSFSMFEVTIEETFAAGHALRNYRGQVRERARPQLPLPGDAGGRAAGLHRAAGGFRGGEAAWCTRCSTAWIISGSTSFRRSTCSIRRPRTWPSTSTTK